MRKWMVLWMAIAVVFGAGACGSDVNRRGRDRRRKRGCGSTRNRRSGRGGRTRGRCLGGGRVRAGGDS